MSSATYHKLPEDLLIQLNVTVMESFEQLKSMRCILKESLTEQLGCNLEDLMSKSTENI